MLSRIESKLKHVVRETLRVFAPEERLRESLYRKYGDYTMIPKEVFKENLRLAQAYKDVIGCIVECGVWKGGMTAALAEVMGKERTYYLFDSFEGLPPAQDADGKGALEWQKDVSSPWYFDNCSADILYAEKAMKLSGTPAYHIVKGWFSDTLPGFAPGNQIAILRLDGDWYESTMQCLENLYKYVAPGGLILVDDYYVWDGCAKAIHDFLSRNKLPDRIRTSHGGVCYIVKP